MCGITLRAKAKFGRLHQLLDISPQLARGLLEYLWDSVQDTGDPDIGNAIAVETAAGWTGEPGKLCTALLACGCGKAGFIEEVPGQQGIYRLHDLLQHTPADRLRKWIREQERMERGTTISAIRAAAAKARWDKTRAKSSQKECQGVPEYAKSCKTMQMDSVCMPLHANADAAAVLNIVPDTAPDREFETATETVPMPEPIFEPNIAPNAAPPATREVAPTEVMPDPIPESTLQEIAPTEPAEAACDVASSDSAESRPVYVKAAAYRSLERSVSRLARRLEVHDENDAKIYPAVIPTFQDVHDHFRAMGFYGSADDFIKQFTAKSVKSAVQDDNSVWRIYAYQYVCKTQAQWALDNPNSELEMMRLGGKPLKHQK